MLRRSFGNTACGPQARNVTDDSRIHVLRVALRGPGNETDPLLPRPDDSVQLFDFPTYRAALESLQLSPPGFRIDVAFLGQPSDLDSGRTLQSPEQEGLLEILKTREPAPTIIFWPRSDSKAPTLGTMMRVTRMLTSGQRKEEDVPLSVQETRVLAGLATGHTYRSLADSLGITLNTVRTHVRRVYLKLDVRTGAQAVARGLELGLIDPGS